MNQPFLCVIIIWVYIVRMLLIPEKFPCERIYLDCPRKINLLPQQSSLRDVYSILFLLTGTHRSCINKKSTAILRKWNRWQWLTLEYKYKDCVQYYPYLSAHVLISSHPCFSPINPQVAPNRYPPLHLRSANYAHKPLKTRPPGTHTAWFYSK